MTEIVFALHIEPGKEEADRRMREEMAGPRRAEYVAALKEAGVERQAVWHQQSPSGPWAIVYVVGSDPDAHQRFVNSDADISRWFREQMMEIHGRDVTEPPLPVDLVVDVKTDE